MSERYEQSYQSLSKSLPIHEIKEEALKYSRVYFQWITEMLTKFLPEIKARDMNILELGGGTGGVGLHFLAQGARVTLADISPTALEIAQELAQPYSSQFKVLQADLRFPQQFNHEKFNLIIDSHLLHCLTQPADRISFLSTVKDSLSERGIFVGESMCYKKKLFLPPGYAIGEDKILRQKFNTWIDLRKVSDSFDLEEEFKSIPWQIKFFYYYHHYTFIPSRDFIDVPSDFLPASVRYVLSH